MPTCGPTLAMLPRLQGLLHACVRNRLDACRLMSAGRLTISQVGQGGRLLVRMPQAAAAMKITTEWKDSCDVAISRLPALASPDDDNAGVSESQELGLSSFDSSGLELEVDDTLQQLTVVQKVGREWAGTYLIEAVVPELFSVDLLVGHGSVSMSNKLKGDCRLRLESGDIDVDIVRGECISLSTGCGRVDVHELEGNVDIAATNVGCTVYTDIGLDIDES